MAGIGTRVRQLVARGPFAQFDRADTSSYSGDLGRLAVTRTDINFTNPNTLSCVGSALPVFPVGTPIRISGSASNNRTAIVATSAAGSLTIITKPEFTTESAGRSITVERA